MFVLFLLFACSEYDIAEIPEPNSGANTIVDTAILQEIPDEEVASESVYINTKDSLFFYDPATNTIEFIGDFGTEAGMTDIAVTHTGQMFGITRDTLYQINPTTADTLSIRHLNKLYNGLTTYGPTSLIAAGSSLDVIELYKNETLTIMPDNIFETSGDIVALPDGNFYWTTRGTNGDTLVTVSQDGNIVRWKDLTDSSGIYGLGFANGELYGFTSHQRLIIIDPETGEIKEEKELEGSWWGAATNPIMWQK